MINYTATKKTRLTRFQTTFHYTRDIDGKKGYKIEESAYYDHFDHCNEFNRHPLKFSWRCINPELAKAFRLFSTEILNNTKHKGRVLIKLKSLRKQLLAILPLYSEPIEEIKKIKTQKSK